MSVAKSVLLLCLLACVACDAVKIARQVRLSRSLGNKVSQPAVGHRQIFRGEWPPSWIAGQSSVAVKTDPAAKPQKTNKTVVQRTAGVGKTPTGQKGHEAGQTTSASTLQDVAHP